MNSVSDMTTTPSLEREGSVSAKKPWRIVAVFAVIAAVATAAYFWRLGVSSIANADEGVHALVTRQMRESGDWLTLQIRDRDYFRKPPLSFWVRGVTHNVFGENELTTRLPSAVAGVATTLLLAYWAWLWTKRWSTVLAVGVMFPLLPITFVHTFRTGETDGSLLFLLTLSAFLLWRSVQRPWLVVGAAATIGLSFMTKSVAAGVVPIGFAVALLLTKQWPYQLKHVTTALAAFLIVALPWHIQQLVLYGRKFWDEYIGFHIVQRVEERLHVTPKTHGPFWYLTAVQSGMFPWSWLLVPSIAAAIARARQQVTHRFTEIFLVSWGVGTVVLFSLAATKLAWYIAPAYPALALLIARFITEPFSNQPRWLRWLAAVAVVGYLWRVFQLYRVGVSGALALNFLDARLAVALVVIVAVFVLWLAYRRSPQTGRRWLWIMVMLMLTHMALVSLVIFSRNIRRTYESSFRVFRNAIEAQDPRAAVYFYDIGYYTSPLAYLYLVGPRQQRAVTPLREQPDKLQEVLVNRAGAFVIFEKTRELKPETLVRLSKVTEFGSLALYQVQ